ncbi:MAG: BTAD domain-containing putative transcriptional regulator, partial [Oscillospiraceae bacterium]
MKIKMLGCFELSVGENKINDTSNRTHQIWNLLKYLIINRKLAVSQAELIDALWPDEGSDSPSNALKNLVYRCRTAFAAANIECGKDLIVYRNGTYSWNHQIPCEVDAEQFDQAVEAFEASQADDAQRAALGLSALALYTGNFLPLSAFEKWAVPLTSYYRSRYFKCVNEVNGLLLRQERYEEVCALCSRASEFDVFEESTHHAHILALARLGRLNAALEHYNYVNDLFYRELGVRPSKEMRTVYREIAGTLGNVETDLGIIKEDLCEKDALEGAFFCDYEVFKNMYRIEARAAARNGQSIFIGLLTITGPEDELPERAKLNRAMEE